MNIFTFPRFALIGTLFFFPWGARALTDFSADTSVSSTTFSEDLSVDGDFPDASPLNWNLGLTLTKLKDQSVQPPTTDNTTALRGGIGYRDKGFSATVDLNGANTPNEKLKTFGYILGAGYKLSLGDSAAHKFVQARFVFSETRYSETFSSRRKVTKRGRAVPSTGTSALNQNVSRLELRAKPFKPFTLKVVGSLYTYNHNVETFENNLDSPAAVQRGLNTGMGGVVGGLPSRSLGFGLNTDLSEDWELDLAYTLSILAADRSHSKDLRLTLGWQALDDWRFSAGYERVQGDEYRDELAQFGVEFSLD